MYTWGFCGLYNPKFTHIFFARDFGASVDIASFPHDVLKYTTLKMDGRAYGNQKKPSLNEECQRHCSIYSFRCLHISVLAVIGRGVLYKFGRLVPNLSLIPGQNPQDMVMRYILVCFHRL